MRGCRRRPPPFRFHLCPVPYVFLAEGRLTRASKFLASAWKRLSAEACGRSRNWLRLEPLSRSFEMISGNDKRHRRCGTRPGSLSGLLPWFQGPPLTEWHSTASAFFRCGRGSRGRTRRLLSAGPPQRVPPSTSSYAPEARRSYAAGSCQDTKRAEQYDDNRYKGSGRRYCTRRYCALRD